MLDKSNLHDYQNHLITALYENSELLAIVPMGGGKTVSALTAVSELIRDRHIRGGIVLAPKRVARLVWMKEIHEWAHLKHLRLVLVDGTEIQRVARLATDADLWIVGIDNTVWLTKELALYDSDDRRFDLLIIDEMSRYKAPSGKRSRALSIIADKFKNRWGLTGTPMPNSEMDLFQPARILTRRRIWNTDFATWRMKHFIPDNPITQFHWYLREEHKDEIWSSIADFSFVVDDSQLPPQPELHPVLHWVDLPSDAMNDFKTMLKHLIIEHGVDHVMAENMGVAYGKLDQIAQGFIYENGSTGKPHLDIHRLGSRVFKQVHTAKIDALKELVAGLGGQQAMITYWFKEDLKQIKEAFPDICTLGAERAGNEEMAIQIWNAGEIPLLAVHPASAGHGLNLQKSHAGQIIYYCLPWSPELLDQVRRRVARQGNKRTRVFEHMILARGTLDELKIARHKEKLDLQEAFKAFAASNGVIPE